MSPFSLDTQREFLVTRVLPEYAPLASIPVT